MKKTQLMKRILIPSLTIGLGSIAAGTAMAITSCGSDFIKEFKGTFNKTEKQNYVILKLSNQDFFVYAFTTGDNKQPNQENLGFQSGFMISGVSEEKTDTLECFIQHQSGAAWSDKVNISVWVGCCKEQANSFDDITTWLQSTCELTIS